MTTDSDRLRALAEQLREALAAACPDEPMNQDEQGGCVWCGGGYPTYAGPDPKHHDYDCGWVKGRAAIVTADKVLGPRPKKGS